MLKKYGVTSVKELDERQLNHLCDDLRSVILERVSLNGGHLASNLGSIEATVALAYVFDFPKDKIVFDVGHQCYAYKLLTGRKDRFDSLRKRDGISGFPKRSESEYDSFDTGHAGSAISAALGIAKANELKGTPAHAIAFVGDGSFLNGLVYEALNSIKILKGKILILLNDNGMSISPTVGGMHDILSGAPDQRVKLLESFGLTYMGIADGNDVNEMIKALQAAKNKLSEGSVLLHVSTKKGAGYAFSEEHPVATHGVSVNGKGAVTTYAETLGNTLTALAKEDQKIVAVTAAMTDSLGLRDFFVAYPERSFDVGICEEHACVLAASLAAQGLHPYYAIYSTFLQRAYDEIVHDVCCQDLPVTLCIDRAGISGADGETHQGVFDISYLSSIPNMTIAAPRNRNEFKQMLAFSKDYPHPLAIRYPRDGGNEEEIEPIKDMRWQEIERGEGDVLFLCVGERAVQKAREVCQKVGRRIGVINARFIKPLDEDFLNKIQQNTIITIEDNVKIGGFGERIEAYFGERKKVIAFAYADRFIPQGGVAELMDEFGLSVEEIAGTVKSL